MSVLGVREARRLPGLERRRTPLSDRLFEVLRPWLAVAIPDDARYERGFDDFEYLLALTAVGHGSGSWGPAGRFSWKRDGELGPATRFAAEADARGDDAAFLKAGLFDGSAQRFTDLRSQWMALERTSAFL